jgi:hypothetical protein
VLHDYAKKKRSKKDSMVIPKDDHGVEAKEFNEKSRLPPIPNSQFLIENSMPPMDFNIESIATQDEPSTNISTFGNVSKSTNKALPQSLEGRLMVKLLIS